MRLISSNVRYTLRPRKAAKGMVQVADAAGDRGVVVWQECHTMGHRRGLRSLPDPWASYLPIVEGKPVGAAISWRTDTWRMVATGHRLLHAKVSFVCGPRYIVYVVLEHRRSGETVVFSNRHYVPGAFAKGPMVNAKARRAAWSAGWCRDLAFMEDLAVDGIPHAGGGDYNRPGEFMPRLMAGEKLREFAHGPDHVFTVDAPGLVWEWGYSQALARPEGFDHNPVRAILDLRRFGWRS